MKENIYFLNDPTVAVCNLNSGQMPRASTAEPPLSQSKSLSISMLPIYILTVIAGSILVEYNIKLAL